MCPLTVTERRVTYYRLGINFYSSVLSLFSSLLPFPLPLLPFSPPPFLFHSSLPTSPLFLLFLPTFSSSPLSPSPSSLSPNPSFSFFLSPSLPPVPSPFSSLLSFLPSPSSSSPLLPSNRAECYLKLNQSRKAVRDCNKALAMNPENLKARWRRAQAWQNIGVKYPAALDLL